MDIYSPTTDASNDDLDNQSTTDNTTVRTCPVPAGARAFIISAHTNGVYISLNGQAPASTEGLHIAADVSPVFFPVIPTSGDDLKWISDNAAGSAVSVQWLR